MSSDNEHSEQFEHYLKGKLTPREAHAFERKALDDPFTQEAAEGFETQGLEHLADLDTLRNRIAVKKKSRRVWIRYAAAAVLILSGALSIYLLTEEVGQKQELAIENQTLQEETTPQPSPDTIAIQENTIAERESELSLSEEETESVASLTQDEEMTEAFFSQPETRADEISQSAIASKTGQKPEDIRAPAKVELRRVDMEVSQVVVPTEVSTATEGQAESIQGRVVGVDLEVSDLSLNNKMLKRSNTLEAISREMAPSENPQLTGNVTDETGEPLFGVTVLVKGTTTGAVTDSEGNYLIPKSKDDMTLVYSLVGFESKEVEVADKDSLNVSLDSNLELLEEVVVTGVGASRESEGPFSAYPVGGMRAFRKYLANNLMYPSTALEKKTEGTVVLHITISNDGTLTDVKVLKGLGDGCDEEAIRLVSEGPEWAPAEKNGIKVEDKVKVRVKFKIK